MKRLLIFVSICCNSVIYCQVLDSTNLVEKYPLAEYFQEKNFSQNGSLYNPIDTLLEGVQKYFPNNFTYSLNLAGRKLHFEPLTEIGFRSGFNNLDLFGYNKEAIKYYRARTPYTEVFGVFGMKKEQFSKLLHTQNITKQWNIALNMLRIRSEGFYQRQNCTDNNISFSTNYSSKNNRYSVLANALVSSIKSDENGGIKYDTLFEDNLNVNKKLMPINLKNSRTKSRNREAYMKHSLYFGKKENIMRGDSVISKRIRPDHSISYSFHASDEEFAYTESLLDTGFYKNVFFDSIQTKDSTHTEAFAHGFEAQITLFKKIKIDAGVQQKNRRLVQYNFDSLRVLDSSFSDQIVNIEIGSNANKNKSKGFFWSIGKRYVLKGTHEGDDFIFGDFKFIFKNGQKILLEHHNVYHTVPFVFNHYSSNHFWWKESFLKTKEASTSIGFHNPKHKFSISGGIVRMVNYVYFDSTFSPVVYRGSDAFLYYCLHLHKNFHLKHFGFNNKITWQDVSADVLRLPKFVLNHSVYYEGKWFKKAVDVQAGFDITYCSSYFADAYMPALGQYYLQNEKELGNYPFIDFFFNMKIKHARVFFKSEHVNSGFMGANYFLSPHMPGPDRSIKIGVKWMFFD